MYDVLAPRSGVYVKRESYRATKRALNRHFARHFGMLSFNAGLTCEDVRRQKNEAAVSYHHRADRSAPGLEVRKWATSAAAD